MKKLLLLGTVLLQTVLFSQESIGVSDELIMEDSSYQKIKGDIAISEGNIVLRSNDCEFSSAGDISLILDKRKIKKWQKKIGKNEGVMTGVTVVGTFNKNTIEVKKIKNPFRAPKKQSGASHVDTYVSAVFEAYNRLKKTSEEANYLKFVSKEENDATLGLVTSYTVYDSNCKELNDEEIKALKPKALSSLGKSLESLGELANYQSQLSVLSTNAETELKTLTGIKVLTAQKNYSYAQLVASSLFLEVGKVSANANKTKKILKQLDNE